MAKVPVITSPCPLRFASMPQTGRDFCGKCERQVHNLDGMSFEQRQSFFSSCSGKVCVAYTVRKPGLLPATAMSLAAAISLSALPASAEDHSETAATPSYPTVVTGPSCDTDQSRRLEHMVFLGGTLASEALQWVDESELHESDRPELPEIEVSEWLPTPVTSTP